MSNSSNKPLQTFKAGAVKATIWRNLTTGGKTYYNVSIVRVFMHEEEWKESNSFGRDDLPKVNVVTEKAYEWILAQKNTSKSATKKASKRTPKN